MRRKVEGTGLEKKRLRRSSYNLLIPKKVVTEKAEVLFSSGCILTEDEVIGTSCFSMSG